ncbi:MAG: hypothetical protein WA063_03560 [Minisyncoccia bacterium]
MAWQARPSLKLWRGKPACVRGYGVASKLRVTKQEKLFFKQFLATAYFIT